jgi:hypothetical protein
MVVGVLFCSVLGFVLLSLALVKERSCHRNQFFSLTGRRCLSLSLDVINDTLMRSSYLKIISFSAYQLTFLLVSEGILSWD